MPLYYGVAATVEWHDASSFQRPGCVRGGLPALERLREICVENSNDAEQA